MAYKTLVRPLLKYSSSVWSPYIKSNIASLEMVQRRAARWTLTKYSPYASVTQMLKSLAWRSLEQRRSDSRLYNIIYVLVAIAMPSYVVHQLRIILRNSHALGFRQIQTTVEYYRYTFYPISKFAMEPAASTHITSAHLLLNAINVSVLGFFCFCFF